MKEILSTGFHALGLTPPELAIEQLEEYARLLLEKNQVMNLTAITEPAQVARLHFLDCAALLRCADLTGKTLIDVGTGAGFPGMVLKILVPSLQVTLLDSLAKRLDWLEEVAQRLNLVQIDFIHGRGEERSHDEALREHFDCSTARAVADLSMLSELCLPYVKPGGQFLSMKTVDSDAESNAARSAIHALGGHWACNFDYAIPGTEITHRVVVIEKTAPTPKAYPRRWAKMQKAPL